MPDPAEPQSVKSSPLPLIIVGVVGLVLFGFALYLISDLRGRVNVLEAAAVKQTAETKELQEKLHIVHKDMSASVEELGSKVGLTQDELAKKTSDLKHQQEQASAKLTEQQKATAQQVAAVNSEVSGVKTELGGAKTDIASTRNDLDATRSKLERAIGDLNVQSGLIARNHDELEVLKHKGDRNYFEFTLHKNQKIPVSTVSLQLKKADQKKSRFTMNVIADDRVIEKKDRTLGEPLQFYTGRDRNLYEVVIFTVTKDQVSGYLSSPR